MESSTGAGTLCATLHLLTFPVTNLAYIIYFNL